MFPSLEQVAQYFGGAVVQRWARAPGFVAPLPIAMQTATYGPDDPSASILATNGGLEPLDSNLGITFTEGVLQELKVPKEAAADARCVMLFVFAIRVFEGREFLGVIARTSVSDGASKVYSIGLGISDARVRGRLGWIPKTHATLLTAPGLSWKEARRNSDGEAELCRAWFRFRPVVLGMNGQYRLPN